MGDTKSMAKLEKSLTKPQRKMFLEVVQTKFRRPMNGSASRVWDNLYVKGLVAVCTDGEGCLSPLGQRLNNEIYGYDYPSTEQSWK